MIRDSSIRSTRVLGLVVLAGCGSVAATPDASPDADTMASLTVSTSGPGSLTVTPTGTPCGVGCTSHPLGTTITIQATPLLAGVLATSWTGPCAATAGGQPCSFTLGQDEIVLTTFACSADFIVDAGTGNDTATGTCGAPLRTIKRALVVSAVGQSIRLLPGTYTTPLETFPIVLDGRQLLGDEATKGETTIVRSTTTGNVIEPTGAATIAGLKVTGTGMVNYCVFASMAGSAITIRNNQLTECRDGTSGGGIWISAAGSHSVVGNRIWNNGFHGVAHVGTNPIVRYEGNDIYMNTIGIETNADGADLGGGPAGSAGGNRIYCNTRNDLWLSQSMAMPARNNAFDHSPPVVGADGGGNDIYINAGPPADTTGASLVTNACP